MGCLPLGSPLCRGNVLPTPIAYPDFFSPAGEIAATPPPIAEGEILAVHFGGVGSGPLGNHWTAVATGGAVYGLNLGLESRLSETGASVALTGSALEFGISSDPDSILDVLGVEIGLSLAWSATATLDAPGGELVLKPDTTYRIRFDVDAGSGLLNSTLSISPSFGVELLDGTGAAVGYSGGGTIANLIGLQLESAAGAPEGTGTATVEFQTGASVPAGAAGIRFTGAATLPVSVAGIGTEFATISNLSIGEVTPYLEWVEESDLPDEAWDPDADPDGDGRTNRDEFAVASDPSVGDGENVHAAVGDADGEGPESSVFVMTLPVRSGAVFSAGPNGSRAAVADEVDYRVEGSFELQDWVLAVSEVTPNSDFTNGLPPLPEGWSYRSFRVPGQTSDTPRAFLRVVIE